MKRIVFVLIALTMASISYAQVSFDLRLGTNLSGIPESNNAMKFGLKSGVMVNYGFSDDFAIKSGLFYTEKGMTDAGTPFDFSPDNKVVLNYIELPVLASYSIVGSEKFGIDFNAGPSFAYNINNPEGAFEDVNPIDIGANFGVDFVFNDKVIIGVESQYGVSELLKDSKYHNVIYSLMFGYRF